MMRLVRFVVCLAWISYAGMTRAQDAGAKAPHASSESTQVMLARELFRQGVREAEEGRPHAACDLFERSLALSERPRTRLNLAVTQIRLGRFEAALSNLDILADVREPLDSDIALRVSELRKEIGSVMGRLTLQVAPQDALVEIDGAPVQRVDPQRELLLAPGKHRVTVRHPGYMQLTRDIELRTGQAEVLALTLIESVPVTSSMSHDVSSQPDAAATEKTSLSESKRTGRRRWWIAGASVIVAAGALALTATLLTQRETGARDENPVTVGPSD